MTIGGLCVFTRVPLNLNNLGINKKKYTVQTSIVNFPLSRALSVSFPTSSLASRAIRRRISQHASNFCHAHGRIPYFPISFEKVKDSLKKISRNVVSYFVSASFRMVRKGCQPLSAKTICL